MRCMDIMSRYEMLLIKHIYIFTLVKRIVINAHCFIDARCFFFQRPKLSMNPFYKYDTPITSKAFDARVRAAARAYLS